jgi:hypothetical protein
MIGEIELDVVERQIHEEEENVRRQREIVTILCRAGYVGGRPQRLLAEFEASLAEQRERLASLQSGTSSN